MEEGTAPPQEPEAGTVRPFRVVPHPEVRPFENAVPVYDLKIAAGRFSGEQEPGAGVQGDETAHPELFEWAELPDYYRPRPGMFVAQVTGESMNRRIANGGWGLFQLNPQGSREGKVVLVQHREIQDGDLGRPLHPQAVPQREVPEPRRHLGTHPHRPQSGHLRRRLRADRDRGFRG